MTYDFSKIFDNHNDALIESFVDTHIMTTDIDEDGRAEKVRKYYEEIFELFTRSFSFEEIVTLFKKLAELKVEFDVPYVIISNEMYGLENIIISGLSKKRDHESLLNVIALFKKIDNAVAQVYLCKYIEKLMAMNNVRRSSLSDLVEKNLIQYYESHLIWFSALAEYINNKGKTDFPELDHHQCEFGRWLHGEAKMLIENDSKYHSIVKLHQNLHLFAKKIFHIFKMEEYHILITYLEKCELISLNLGTELALLDQMAINQKIAKDSLTGALNRNALENVFESQYEIALATNNSFVVAMCDLDYFKNINDTYGHLAGDLALKEFVALVKKNIRGSDLIIRYGGEEFVILLSAINEQKGYEVLDNIRELFAQNRIVHEGREIKCSVSIGMSEIQPQKYFKNSMLNKYLMEVDQELYMAKANGRNRVYR